LGKDENSNRISLKLFACIEKIDFLRDVLMSFENDTVVYCYQRIELKKESFQESDLILLLKTVLILQRRINY